MQNREIHMNMLVEASNELANERKLLVILLKESLNHLSEVAQESVVEKCDAIYSDYNDLEDSMKEIPGLLSQAISYHEALAFINELKVKHNTFCVNINTLQSMIYRNMIDSQYFKQENLDVLNEKLMGIDVYKKWFITTLPSNSALKFFKDHILCCCKSSHSSGSPNLTGESSDVSQLGKLSEWYLKLMTPTAPSEDGVIQLDEYESVVDDEILVGRFERFLITSPIKQRAQDLILVNNNNNNNTNDEDTALMNRFDRLTNKPQSNSGPSTVNLEKPKRDDFDEVDREIYDQFQKVMKK